MDDRLERNKRTVKEFYDLMFNQNQRGKRSRSTSATGTSRVHFVRALAEGGQIFSLITRNWAKCAPTRYIPRSFGPISPHPQQLRHLFRRATPGETT
jgi:hypothetical protein